MWLVFRGCNPHWRHKGDARACTLRVYSAKSSALLGSVNDMKCPGQERKGRLAGEIQSETTNTVKGTKQKENKMQAPSVGFSFYIRRYREFHS